MPHRLFWSDRDTTVLLLRLVKITDDDLKKAEEFVDVMRIMYTSTLAVSSDKQATCSQILPIHTKLENHFKIAAEDSPFVATIKGKVWGDLSSRYQVHSVHTHTHHPLHLLWLDAEHFCILFFYYLALAKTIVILCETTVYFVNRMMMIW